MSGSGSGPVRRRIPKALRDYDPDNDIELKGLGEGSNKKNKGGAKVRYKSLKEWNGCGRCLAFIFETLESNTLLDMVGELDALTGYRPFNFLRDFYQPYTTGLSMAYLCFFIIATAGAFYFDIQRYLAAEERIDSLSALTDNAGRQIPLFTGVSYVPPSSGTGSVTVSTKFYQCVELTDSVQTSRNCTEITTQACSSVSGFELSTTESTTVTSLGLTCPSTRGQIRRSKVADGSDFVRAEIVFTGSSTDVASLLNAGGQFYVAVASYPKDNDNYAKFNFDHNTVNMRSWQASSTSRINVEAQYLPVNQNLISRLSVLDYSNIEKYLTASGPNLFTAYTTTLSPVTAGSNAGTTIVMAAEFKAQKLNSNIQIGDRLFVDNLVYLAGFVYFIYLLGFFVRLYNRWSFRYGRDFSSGLLQSQNQLAGGNGEILANISYNAYMQSFFSTIFMPEPVGHEMMDRIEEEYVDFDSWKQARQMYKSVEGLRNSVTALKANKNSVKDNIDPQQ
mmetsp:Transcript_42429/g.68882  ORF Transcript_42429/g.68882 Transcript_42429/m.68882 type:complete len:505 (+) Transcript_42429:82-1596(+)